MLQTSLLLMKSLNKIETPIFCSVFFISKGSLCDVYFNSTLRYLDALFNIDNLYFDQMVDSIYSTELQLNIANSSDTEAPFLCEAMSNGTFSTTIYYKRDDSDFDTYNIPFHVGDVPWRTSYRVYISQLIRFVRASSNLSDFNCCNKALTAKLLRQVYRYF